jgi:hypothetical protein
MNLRNDPTSRPWLIQVRKILSVIAVGVLGAQVGFAQESKPPTPGAVANPNDDINPKQFGRPLIIESRGKEIRTIWMYEGRTTVDQRDPARVVYYHGLDLALVPSEKSLPGFPDWVQDVTQRDGDTIVEVRFRLSSPKLRRACEAKLLGDMRDFFDREKERLKVPALKVEVLKIPAWELFIAVQDSATKLTLAYDTQHIANLGEDVVMSFRFRPEDLSLFMRVAKEGKLQFKPYYKVRADQIITGEKQTNVAYDVGLKVKQLLDHRQQSKLKNDDENTIHPILQDHVNRISRQVSMDIKSRITASDPDVITFLHNDTMLVASCFDPANTLSYADFRRAFPTYSEEMLAEYLKPYGVTKDYRQINEKQSGTQHTDEKSKQSGGGLGFSLSVGPLALGSSGSKEDAERVLDTIYNATGVRLVSGGSENYYKPAEVKVHKLAEGFEQRKLTQASSITLTKGVVNSYLEESPFPQTYVAEVVVKSYEKTESQNDHVARLLTKKAQLEAALAAELRKIGRSRSSLASLISSVDVEHRTAHDAHLSVQQAKWDAGRSQGMVEWIGHAKAVWGWNCPDGNEVGGRSRDRDNALATANGPNEVIRQQDAAIAQQVSQAAAESSAVNAALTEIARLRSAIDDLDKAILSILGR